MKILVVDHDEMSASLLKSRLEPLGHAVTYSPARHEAASEFSKADYDVVFVDPSPSTNPKPMVMNLRRQIRYNPYMVLMSESFGEEAALGFGFNDYLPKPMDLSQIDQKMENAKHFLSLVQHLRDGSQDFPSAGGIIAKSAINQLFLSCIDRADRYAEKTYALFIGLRNFKQIAVESGPYEAEVAGARLAQHIVRLRRASDIIGQISMNEYALLLLRPVDAQEPIEAAARFADSLGICKDILTKPDMKVEIDVKLLEIPSGAKLAEHQVMLSS
ncbi:MAG: DNA-binding response regulator [Micavibrio aeruginosavorus]|uniref:DNA-binding response regulator n=1 Tax=Micavibrio aeruginosavorus TaxID=349221 RepID=A0A2W5FPJ9_9BACT|nr:MAG: DNA-binding response regulator [Micavibrio aeruginosavorus]